MIDIAAFLSFSAQPASLQAHVQQTRSEGRPAVHDPFSQLFVQIKHRYFTP